VAAVAVSGVLFYRASQLNKQGDSEANMASRQHLYDQASSRNLTGAIVGITGAVVIAAGIIKLAWHHHSLPQPTAITISINSRGIFAAGRF
jgi:hypothetical protein